MAQQKNAFDCDTLNKIVKSFVLSLVSALGAGIVAYSQTKSVEASLLVALGTFGGFLVNIADEYRKGNE